MIKEQLRILVEIGHPAHVHFFKNTISLLQSQGHSVLIATRDKDITHQLLDEMGMSYIPITKQQQNIVLLAIELIIRWIKIFLIIKKRKIDVALSISGISTALPAYISRIVSITDTDTEDATLSNYIAFPFSDVVITPTAYLNKERIKHLTTYNSYHELAYLHPRRFAPREKSSIPLLRNSNKKYIIIRLVNLKALHDTNISCITEKNLHALVQHMGKREYNVFISTERRLSASFSAHCIKNNVSDMLDLLAYAEGYVGESPTMAMEAAIVGKPSVLISRRGNRLGYIQEMKETYNLIQVFDEFEPAYNYICTDYISEESVRVAAINQKKMINEKIDVTRWLSEFVVDFYNQRKNG